MKRYEYNPSEPMAFMDLISDSGWIFSMSNLPTTNQTHSNNTLQSAFKKQEVAISKLQVQENSDKSRSEVVNVIMQGQREVSQEK